MLYLKNDFEKFRLKINRLNFVIIIFVNELIVMNCIDDRYALLK